MQNKLSRKVDIMNQLNPDCYSIANLTLDQIFGSLAKKDESPEKIWQSITNAFGADFFLAQIEKSLGSRLSMDNRALEK